jgi:hypothetical protein
VRDTTAPEADPLDGLEFDDADLERAQKVSAVFNWATRLVFGTVCAFSAGQGHETLTLVAVTGILAWVLTPAVDVALGACLYAAAPLRKWGVPVAGGIFAEIVFAVMGLALNCGAPLMRRDAAGDLAPDFASAGYHTIPVILLVATTLVAAAYQKHYARIIRLAHEQVAQKLGAERAAKQARQDEQRAARQAELDREHERRMEIERAAAAAREAEALAAAEQAEMERVRLEAQRAAAQLEADRVRFAAQAEDARVRLEAERVRADRAAARTARGSVTGSGSDRPQGPVRQRAGSENGSEPESDRTDEDLLDQTRLLFERHRVAGTRQPSIDATREHLRIKKERARDFHRQVAAEEAARAVARNTQPAPAEN